MSAGNSSTNVCMMQIAHLAKLNQPAAEPATLSLNNVCVCGQLGTRLCDMRQSLVDFKCGITEGQGT